MYTRVGLAISEIVSLNKFTALGTDLTLPTTADREINTVIRARPGDMILLGGITINRDASQVKRGISQNGTADEVSRSELVLAMKAKVVYFRGKNFKTAQQKAPAPHSEITTPAPTQQNGKPDAVPAAPEQMRETAQSAPATTSSALRLSYSLPPDWKLPALSIVDH